MNAGRKLLIAVGGLAFLVMPARAEVNEAQPGGFRITIARKVDRPPQEAYADLTTGIAQWWDADHSYSGEAANFSMDFEKGCLLEKLPEGGFVRHLEIVFHQPGKMLRLSGGLGPLQGMGVSGAMTFELRPVGDAATELRLTYVVAGLDTLKLDQIAPAVNQVLEGQLDRWQSFGNRSTEGDPPQ